MKKIMDVVNRSVVTVGREANLQNVVELMKEKNIGRIPVVEDGRILGVVTRDDILLREEKAPQPPVIAFWDLLITLPNSKSFQDKVKKMSTFNVEELMSIEYLISSEEDRLEDVVTKMLEENYSYTLVLKGEKLVGIVTKSDLINNCF